MSILLAMTDLDINFIFKKKPKLLLTTENMYVKSYLEKFQIRIASKYTLL